MRIVVNHLTRMKTGARICVAGVDVKTLAHVRPVTPSTDPITRSLLCENGGPFAVGALVDLGSVTPQPNAPETEDHHFQTKNAKLVEILEPAKYWDMLGEVAVDSLEQAFGPDLEQRNRGYATLKGHGPRSLAVVLANGRPSLTINRWGGLRLSLTYPDSEASFSVSDVRFCEADHKTIRAAVVSDVQERLQSGIEAYMMLGLSRAFLANLDDRERHWVQVNGLCLADNPVGDIP